MRRRRLPIFLLSGIVLCASAVVEGVMLISERLNQEPQIAVVQEEPAKLIPEQKRTIRQTNIFDDLHRKHPKYKPLIERLEQVNIQTFPHNLVWGNPRADVELVIFNDLSCISCRQEVKRVIKNLKRHENQVRIVYKTASANPLELDAEIFLQMADRAGVGLSYFNEIISKRRPLSEEEYMLILEESGVDLQLMREMMRKKTRDIVKDIQMDLKQARALGMPEHVHLPAFYLNGYRLGQHYLPQHQFETYLQRLVAGLPIVDTQ